MDDDGLVRTESNLLQGNIPRRVALHGGGPPESRHAGAQPQDGGRLQQRRQLQGTFQATALLSEAGQCEETDDTNSYRLVCFKDLFQKLKYKETASLVIVTQLCQRELESQSDIILHN